MTRPTPPWRPTLELTRVLSTREAALFAALGVTTVGELMSYYPFRVTERGELLSIGEMREGEYVTIIGRVVNRKITNGQRARLFLTVTDGQHTVGINFFGNPRTVSWWTSHFTLNSVHAFSGKVNAFNGYLNLNNPEHEMVEGPDTLDRLGRPVVIYHASAKLPSYRISKKITEILPNVTPPDEVMPEDYRRLHGLMTLTEARRAIHVPTSGDEWKQARDTLTHFEALMLQLYLAYRKREKSELTTTSYPYVPGGLVDRFTEALPFPLTEGQKKVGADIAADLARSAPMNRLLQGDVGAGKTVVAVRAALQVIEHGAQALMIAPTEVLARQHYQSIRALLGPLARGGELDAEPGAIRVELLTASATVPQRRAILARLAGGESDFVIGTHSLISDDVQLPFLGLSIIDEQHRFGVNQRDAVARGAHTLVMTATPIPRTLALAAFGDMDQSLLRDKPAGRATVTTYPANQPSPEFMDRAWERAAEEIAAGHLVFVICPKIEDDGGVIDVAQRLGASRWFTPSQVGVVHGKMSAEEKDAALAAFTEGTKPLLVATTVVEVGVDIPMATMMVILDADRFGLSTLHQLRGRIGRGTIDSTCIVATAAPTHSAVERLVKFSRTTDGFDLAEMDLENREEGNMLGTEQSGTISSLRLLSIRRHGAIIEAAREGALEYVASHPQPSPELAAAFPKDSDYAEKL